VKDSLEQEWEESMRQLDELLCQLDRADMDPTLAEFMEEDKIAQVVVCQLLDTIDGLQAELEREKRARRNDSPVLHQ
jgi:hypothetical protein